MANRLAPLAVASIVLLALTGCNAGGGGAGDPTESAPPVDGAAGGGGAGGGTTTECVSGAWMLDTADAANQLLAYLQDSGSPVTSTTASGRVDLQINDDGTMDYRTGVSYQFTADLEGGLELVFTQNQAGQSTGEWGWEGDSNSVMSFANWVNSIVVTNSVSIGGEAADLPIDLPASSPDGRPMAVTCSDTKLSLQTEGSPFTLNWTR